jgi:Reverse transcriptase (RNA-dependent DNA polymerase)
MWRRMQAAVNHSSHVQPDPVELAAFFSDKFAGPGVLACPAGDEGGQLPADDVVEQVVNDATVGHALKKVNRRSASGKPGVPVQAPADQAVRTVLVTLLQAIYKAGVEPDSMQGTLLVAVFKRGDRSLATSYRPIMVSTVLHKVMANIVNQQMLEHREQAADQGEDPLPRHCGFLPERSTLHNLFVLQNAMHHAQHKRQGLAVMLLDISAAYDSASQQVLLDTLRQQQLPEHVVRMVQGMYAGLKCQLVGDRGVPGATVQVGVGVKQGCPASPLLYCWYVQPVSSHLEQLQTATR